MPYTITITCDNLSAFVELARLIDSHGLNSDSFESERASKKNMLGDPTPVKEPKAQKKAEPKPEAPVKEASNEVTYEHVKTAVFEVAKKLGREASLDLLSPFGVVQGEGNERKGEINALKPEQYAEVIAAAKLKLSA